MGTFNQVESMHYLPNSLEGGWVFTHQKQKLNDTRVKTPHGFDKTTGSLCIFPSALGFLEEANFISVFFLNFLYF